MLRRSERSAKEASAVRISDRYDVKYVRDSRRLLNVNEGKYKGSDELPARFRSHCNRFPQRTADGRSSLCSPSRTVDITLFSGHI